MCWHLRGHFITLWGHLREHFGCISLSSGSPESTSGLWDNLIFHYDACHDQQVETLCTTINLLPPSLLNSTAFNLPHAVCLLNSLLFWSQCPRGVLDYTQRSSFCSSLLLLNPEHVRLSVLQESELCSFSPPLPGLMLHLRHQLTLISCD